MNTQAMSIERGVIDADNHEYKSIEEKEVKVKSQRLISELLKGEIKEIINEVLDERERRYEMEDDSWLYRGTY